MDEVHTMDGFIQISKLWEKVIREAHNPQIPHPPHPPNKTFGVNEGRKKTRATNCWSFLGLLEGV